MNQIRFPIVIGAFLLAFSSAHAAPASDEKIQFLVTPAGLDLNTAAGVDAYNQRIKSGALRACMEAQGIDNTLAGQTMLDDCMHRTVKAAIAAAPIDLAALLAAKHG